MTRSEAKPAEDLVAAQVLEFYGFVGGMTKWHYLAVEACFFSVFFLGAYLSLGYIKHHRR